MLFVWIVVAIVVLLIVYVVVAYNGLVSLRNRIENGWAQIDVQLKRRYDLIPNLVETVKGYAAHERETLDAVIQARNSAMAAAGPQDQAAAENMITGALKSVFALSEAYPDLKANENFLNLQEELTGTEGRIAYARQFYNDTVFALQHEDPVGARPTSSPTSSASPSASTSRSTTPLALQRRGRLRRHRHPAVGRPRRPACRPSR